MGNDSSKTESDCPETYLSTSPRCEPNHDFGYGMVQNVLERSTGRNNSKLKNFHREPCADLFQRHLTYTNLLFSDEFLLLFNKSF